MRVGHHIAVAREDETRAHAARLLLLGLRRLARRALARHVGHRQPEAAEEFKHVLVHAQALGAARHLLHGPDVDHRGADLIHEIGEIGQTPRRQRRRLGLGLGHGQYAAKPAKRQGHGTGQGAGLEGLASHSGHKQFPWWFSKPWRAAGQIIKAEPHCDKAAGRHDATLALRGPPHRHPS